MKIGRLGLALALVVVLVSGCGGGSAREPTEAGARAGKSQDHAQKLKTFDLSLEGYPDAENVGVLMADRRGYFAEAGLEVNVLHPIDSDNVPGYVAGGGDEVGLLPQPQVVVSKERGLPLVAIGSLVGRPTMAMIWPKGSKVHNLADLRGKTIAINGFPFEEAFLEALLKRAGLNAADVKVKSVSYGLVSALAKERADAILGSGNIEGLELQARGLQPVVTPLQQLGVPSYEELVMVVRRDRLAGDPRWIGRFKSAVARGTAAAIEDPKAAAEAILAARKELELPAAKPGLVEAKVKATLPLLSRSGRLSARRARGLVGWMHREGVKTQ